MPETNESKRFFVVWSPQGGPPVARFANFEAARSAAIRLSLRLPEQDFFVLASCWGRIAKPAEPLGEAGASGEAGAPGEPVRPKELP